MTQQYDKTAQVVIPPTSYSPYIWAGIGMASIGAAFVLGILKLRPTVDPLLVIGAVVAGSSTVFGSICTFLKSQETHLSVNSRLTAFMQAATDAASAKGQLKGTADEQARQAALPSSEVRP